jgi:cytochrome P450
MSAFRSFVLGMLIRPDVQLKIQKEIDSVVGPDRLPEFSDIPRLQYLSIVMKETFRFVIGLSSISLTLLLTFESRWNPVAPMGIAHTTSNDDVYEGYYIPKGCVVFANT